MTPYIIDDNFLNTLMDELFVPLKNMEEAGKAQSMKADIIEDQNNFELSVDLPGFSKDEIKVELEEGLIKIKACHSSENEESDKDKKYLRRERYTGSVQRSFNLGEDIVPENITAKYNDGILTLNIPKKEQVIPTRQSIAIE